MTERGARQTRSRSGYDRERPESNPRAPSNAFRDSLNLRPARKFDVKRFAISVVAAIVLLRGLSIVAFALTVANPRPREVLPVPPIPPIHLATARVPVVPAVRLAGSSFAITKIVPALANAWSARPKATSVRFETQTTSHTAGLLALLRNEADVWIATGPIEEADLDAVRRAGLAKAPAIDQWRRAGNEAQIASTALVLLANRENPVAALTPAQTAKLFTGELTAWAQVGGPSNLPVGRFVLAAVREETDWFCAGYMAQAAAGPCLRSVGLTVEPPMEAPSMLVERIAASPAAIGYAEFADRGDARIMGLATDCGSVIEPSVFRIKAGDYPAVRRLYVYTAPGRPLPAQVKAFLDFALGPAGQAALTERGLTDANPVLGGDTTTNGQRLSLTFRFPAGASAPDAAADGDAARLIAWLRQPAYAKAQVTLIGHADPTEAASIAQDRAEAVRSKLRAAGLRTISATAMGATAPVACPSDPRTAALNRRVEVWIRAAR